LRPDDEISTKEFALYLRVKILDFGLVRLEQDGGWRKRNSIVGTPAYMAPEQAAGQTADTRSDLYSLGVVFFRMLTGRLPFEGDAPMEILTAVASEVAPPVTKFNPNVPPPVAALVQQLLSRNPNDRLQSANALVETITEIEQQLSALPTPPPPPHKSNRLAWLIPVALVFLTTACLLGWYWWTGHHRPAQEVPSIQASRLDAAVLTPGEAAQLVGDDITVEFVVGWVCRSDEQIFVYETAPKTNEPAFRLSLPKHIITTMQNRGARWPEALSGARLRVHGTVYRDGNFAEVLVSDLDQFDKIIYPERGEAKKTDRVAKDDGEQPLGPTPTAPRAPDTKEGKELADSLEEAAKSILAPFLNKDAPKK
jgi:hypothetical protein